jgi:EmrB/QacA subfamily drug resistance transporter
MPISISAERRRYVAASIMLANFMVAVEATIVATAMPRIVGDLGGFNYYSWVFSAFLLTQSATTVLYGKLSDVFGRKPILLFGIVVFLIGSLLSGFATSMVALIAFRLLQGLGAGAIQPVTMTIVGDLYTLEERPRIQGIMSSVWAVSAVLGPLCGGLIVEHLPWAYIFWINLPIGVLTIIGFITFLDEKLERREHSVDYLGSALFSIAIVALLLLLTEWNAGAALLLPLAAVFGVATALFVWQERRTREPIISVALWGQRLIATSNAATVFAGMVFIGVTTVLPLYVQGVMGWSTVIAGFTLTALVIGWPLSIMAASRVFRRFGMRNTLRYGSLLLPLGAIILALTGPETSPIVPAVGAFVMGGGMGIISLVTVALVQESVEWQDRGSATASIMFARSLGNTMGATVLGAVLNSGIAILAAGALGTAIQQVLDQPTGLANLAQNPAARAVFDQALHWTFYTVVALAAQTSICTFMVPIGKGFGQKSPTAREVNDAIAPIGDAEA